MVTVLALPHAIRDMKRYFEILSVLVQHGFSDIVQETNLDRLLEKGRSLVGMQGVSTFHHIKRSVRLRQVMEALGPTFIKLGQVLSTRPDLIPREWAEEFEGLQSTCAAIPFPAIRTRLEAEFPAGLDKVFKSIDETPLATASIAQVHRAVLSNGTPLLLKIVRPGTEELIDADFAILHTIAELTEHYFGSLGYSPTEVVKEFSRSIARELDLIHEGRATERFRDIFDKDEDIVFPKVYWEATTKSVLGVEEIKGNLLSQVEYAKISNDDRRALVTNGARAVFRQCLEVGFFHADPHPGNLIALPGGRIAFIDCGMTGQLDAETLQHLSVLASGVVSGDVESVTRVVAALADAPQSMVEDRAFRADVREFVAHFEHTPLSSLNFGVLLQEFFEKIRLHHLRCPADLVLLIKALTTIESVGRDLDPSFDMVTFAEPYVTELVTRRYTVTSIKRRANRALLEYADLAEKLPYDLGQLLKQLRRNKFSINLEHRGFSQLPETLEHASRNIGFSLVVAALLVSSSILVLADRGVGGHLSTVGMIGFGVACAFIAVRVIANFRRKS